MAAADVLRVTVTRRTSAAAITGPARVCSSPVGTVEEMCSAYAASGRPCSSSSPSSIM